MRFAIAVCAAVVLSAPLPVAARQYPTKTVTFISPGTPAGRMDHVHQTQFTCITGVKAQQRRPCQK